MSLFARNYSLSSSTTPEDETPPGAKARFRGAVSTEQSASDHLEVPGSPNSALSKTRSLFSSALKGRRPQNSLGFELGELTLGNLPSPSMLSPRTELPVLGYTPSLGLISSATQGPHCEIVKAEPPAYIKDSKIEYFTTPARKESKHITIALDPLALSRARKTIQACRKSEAGYSTYEACMEGARGHEKKSGTYAQGSEKAKHHLSRSSELFGSALAFKPDQVEALIGKCRVVVALASDYQSAETAVPDLRDALADIQDAQDSGDLKRRLKTLALQAKALTLLSSLLHELEHNGVVPNRSKTWESEIGQTAQQALKLYEEVAATLVDEAEQTEPGTATAKSAALKATEALLSLARGALQVGNLSPTPFVADDHYAMVELALDQASTMVLKAKPASTVELSINNPFLTHIHLLSCEASVGRIQHLFAINGAFDEDEFKAVISDLEVLSDRERSRTKSMRGSKASAASSSAFQSLKQLADTRYSYACLLRQIWRKRKALPAGARRTSTSSVASSGSESSSRRNSADASNKLHPVLLATVPRKVSKTGSARTISFADDAIPELDESLDDQKRRSVSSESAQSDEAVITPVVSVPIPASNRTVSWATGPEAMSPRRHDHHLLKRPSFISPFDPEAAFTAVGLQNPGGLPLARKLSWKPTGDLGALRARRLSSIGFAKQDASVSAWNRKASIVSISSDEGSSTSSSALVSSAWNSLSEGIKEYKVSLTILSSSNFSAAELAQTKSEVLLAIADASLFKASLAPRLPVAAEKRTPLLVAAEVYATWAAREVGWASVIEGTREAEVKDKRTASWAADEHGKIAVLTLLRTWWYRAASSPPREVDIKNAAKEAADKVTRRLAQREGVNNSLVAKYRYKLLKADGDLDTSENLFWTSVSKSLRT
ncbi:hypothetical protein QFC21_004255 [Naganishia friedmannii]|uniref:Uncharacterized protein n=1 Tax=Naganishia friedmannii TaxID=89922 RepID=A0ACC2VHK0_9TREE|nr:hypothetical protein QFC21_004255 [Naganishia friedmannii]